MDVLRREQALAALLPEVFRCDRLVLLGDVIELRQLPLDCFARPHDVAAVGRRLAHDVQRDADRRQRVA